MITFKHLHRPQRTKWHRTLAVAYDGGKSIATLYFLYCLAAGWHHLIERILPQ